MQGEGKNSTRKRAPKKRDNLAPFARVRPELCREHNTRKPTTREGGDKTSGRELVPPKRCACPRLAQSTEEENRKREGQKTEVGRAATGTRLLLDSLFCPTPAARIQLHPLPGKLAHHLRRTFTSCLLLAPSTPATRLEKKRPRACPKLAPTLSSILASCSLHVCSVHAWFASRLAHVSLTLGRCGWFTLGSGALQAWPTLGSPSARLKLQLCADQYFAARLARARFLSQSDRGSTNARGASSPHHRSL